MTTRSMPCLKTGGAIGELWGSTLVPSWAQSAPPPAPADSRPAAAAVASAQSAPAVAAVTFLVRGVIKSGATPIPGATVTASNTLTGKKVSTASAIDGSFVLPLPARGRYVVKAEQAAFA